MKVLYLERVSCDMPWGFRMVGGCDYGQPIIVHKVSGGSIAWGNLMPGDVLLEVMGMPTQHMTHNEAMQAIKSAGTTLQLAVSRDEEDPQKEAYPVICQPPQSKNQKSSLALAKPECFDFTPVVESLEECSEPPQPPIPAPPGDYQEYDPTWKNTTLQECTVPSPPSSNLPVDIFSKSSVKPFTYVTDIHDIQAQREKIKKRGLSRMVPSYQSHMQLPPDSAVVENLQFNSPLQLYSSDNVVDSLKMQTGADVEHIEGLQNKKALDIQQSEVYKMIHTPEADRPRNVVFPEGAKTPEKKDDETSGIDRSSIYKLSGFGRGNRCNKGVPSRSFRMLQNMTGSDDLYHAPKTRVN